MSANHRYDVFMLSVEIQHALIICLNQRITAGKEKSAVQFAFQQAEPAAGSQWFFLVIPCDVIVMLIFSKISFHELFFIVHDHMKFAAAV